MKQYTIYSMFVLLLLVVCPSCKRKKRRLPDNLAPLAWSKEPEEVARKKRVLIISSIGGGAHTAASLAIKQYLGNDYLVASVNIFSDIIRPLDPFRFFSADYSSEHFYNDLLSRQSIFLVETFAFLGKTTFRWISGSTDELIEQYVEENKPDIIISVIPFINGSIYRVAKKMNIPFAIIPVDLDVRNYCNDLYAPDYKKFIFGLNFKDDAIRENTKRIKISEEQTRYLGFPVRPEFLQKGKDIAQIKDEFKIPHDKKVVMILMGSAGSGATLRYAKTLAYADPKKFAAPVHLILCLGRNERLRAAIDELKFPPHITVSVIGFTDRIADLMRASDILITKAGPASVCEAICIGVPMIIDRTQPILWWEQMNIDFVKDHKFGDELKRIRKLPKMLNHYLEDEDELAQMRARMQAFEFPHVISNVRALIDEFAA